MSLDGVSFLDESGMMGGGAGFGDGSAGESGFGFGAGGGSGFGGGGGVTYPGVEPGGELVVSRTGERSVRWRNRDGMIVARVVGLNLRDNKLKGEFPLEWVCTDLPELGCPLAGLVSMYLSENDLSGKMPDLSKLRFLEVLEVSHNGLVGNLDDVAPLLPPVSGSDGWGGESDRRRLPVAHTHTHSTPPPAPPPPPSQTLKVLNLDYNFFRGPLTELFLSSFPVVETMRLTHNKLNCAIPDGSWCALRGDGVGGGGMTTADHGRCLPLTVTSVPPHDS